MASRPPDDRLTATPPTATETKRFVVMNVLRLSGVAFVIAGLLVVNGVIDIAPAAGYVFIAVGLVDVFVGPLVLARRWRSPKP